MMELMVYTNEGKTYHFKDVTDFAHTTQGFSFVHIGVSTGVKRTTVFNYTCVAGYSIAEGD